MVSIFFAILFIAISARSEIYKWVDSEGEIHYSETRPTEDNFETIKIKNNIDTQNAINSLEKKSKSLKKMRKKRKEKKQAAIAAKEELARNKELCDQAKKQLASYQHPKVTLEEKDGTLRALGEEEKQLAIKKGKEIVEEACNY